MSEESKAFHEAKDRKSKTSAAIVEQFIANKYAWDYGFYDGWDEAMKAKFDDRSTLAKWHRASKHVFCPCDESEQCNSNCPHGRQYMSGSCEWCRNKFDTMEAETPLVVKPELIKCRFDVAWVGICKQESEQEFCEKHRQDKCFKCGKQATRSCDMTMGLVCGMPECDEHKHKHQ